MEFILVFIFPFLDRIQIFTPFNTAFSPSTGKYRPDKTPHSGNFQTMITTPLNIHSEVKCHPSIRALPTVFTTPLIKGFI